MIRTEARLASLESPERSSATGCSILKIAVVGGSMVFPAGCRAVGKTEQDNRREPRYVFNFPTDGSGR
jgi:hypothetical protein